MATPGRVVRKGRNGVQGKEDTRHTGGQSLALVPDPYEDKRFRRHGTIILCSQAGVIKVLGS